MQDKTVVAKVKGVCVTKKTFDTFVENKFVVADEVIQRVKMAGVPGLQVMKTGFAWLRIVGRV